MLVAVLSACVAGRPALAYDISQTAKNNSTGNFFGQKMVLYGGQAVQMEASANFNKNTAAAGATSTS